MQNVNEAAVEMLQGLAGEIEAGQLRVGWWQLDRPVVPHATALTASIGYEQGDEIVLEMRLTRAARGDDGGA